MSNTLKGVVKWFNDAKGFGFIEHTSGQDVFVHYSVITQDGYKSLKDGEEVLYELVEGPKGLQAKSVHRVNPPEESSKRAAAKAIVYEIPEITGTSSDSARLDALREDSHSETSASENSQSTVDAAP